ncbi:sucrose synthase [Nostoc sp. FACHB-145]|uniref:sucrose synthase n=1 Tax=Nostoc sp. FACHB-145 TaxID=2692836 RepID=UPI0016862574|nr:sucrose synthase [Nostoc sp. FACHB-145]MBD2469313.1 sucrose synthase [Nostoc sp. FACHB-145]
MNELLHAVLNSDEKADLQQLIFLLTASGKNYFLRNQILQVFADYCHNSQKPAYFYYSSSLGRLIDYTHEIILAEENTWFVLRPKIASQELWRLNADLSQCELMSPQAFLDMRDRLVNRYQPHILEIDLDPFYEDLPSVDDPRNIGQGLAFLNHYLCNQLLNDPQRWLEILFRALRRVQYDGKRLLIGDRIRSGIQFAKQIKQALQFLSDRPADEPYEKFRVHLQDIGLEPGWGNTAARVSETLSLLDRLIDTPQPAILEAFVARVPAVFRVVLVSIHGWVGQKDVLGRDETLGQVVYVLEQAHSLENKLREEIKLAGLDVLGIKPHIIILTRLIPNCEGTSCGLRLEKVEDTENAWILRVPFAEFNPEITNNWISKFEIWPYLDNFANDAEKELLAVFQGRPNLIIGNYSDGSLVASVLSQRLKITQCNIAHSLEKPKYLFSNLYWHELEDKYHFSAQFTADLISMNAADFIITSSYQEIVGTPDSIGQYESYKCFTMPQLYHVVNGIDLFSPKFNLVPPGVNQKIFFPYSQKAGRDLNRTKQVEDLIFNRQDQHILGNLDEQNKRNIFAVATLTSIKNMAGLAECFSKSEELQKRCNLILLTSKLHPSEAANAEEAEEIQRLHDIINEHHLHNHIRWLGMRLSSDELGEAYRVIADRQGIYVDYARFEAFGISILEAMICGLPSFATKFGGASEILENREDGFIVNPTDLEGTAQSILNFFDKCENNPHYWEEVSEWMSQRILNNYNWSSHANQVLLLAKMFSFWNFVAPANNEARDRYMETLFHLIYKPRAEKILEQHMHKHN